MSDERDRLEAKAVLLAMPPTQRCHQNPGSFTRGYLAALKAERARWSAVEEALEWYAKSGERTWLLDCDVSCPEPGVSKLTPGKRARAALDALRKRRGG